METDDIPTHKYSLWVPMADFADVACLGKLIEEANELAGIAARCIIQGGLDKIEPVTHKPNRRALEDEIADVLALIALTTSRFGLDLEAIEKRRIAKFDYKLPWLRDLDESLRP
jgi:NTP pyrophosphatase (non-canonical NTP hydrolase)